MAKAWQECNRPPKSSLFALMSSSQGCSAGPPAISWTALQMPYGRGLAGCDFVCDGRSMPPALTDHTNYPVPVWGWSTVVLNIHKTPSWARLCKEGMAHAFSLVAATLTSCKTLYPPPPPLHLTRTEISTCPPLTSLSSLCLPAYLYLYMFWFGCAVVELQDDEGECLHLQHLFVAVRTQNLYVFQEFNKSFDSVSCQCVKDQSRCHHIFMYVLRGPFLKQMGNLSVKVKKIKKIFVGWSVTRMNHKINN